MTTRPAIGWIPALALLFLALRPSTVRERVDAGEPTTAARAAACRDEGCGCPHERVDEECCCAPTLQSAESTATVRMPKVERSIARAPAQRPPASLHARLESGERPAPVVVDFHCAGGKRPGATRSSSVAPALLATEALLALETPRPTRTSLEPGPPFDRSTEPSVPPPRSPARS